VVEASGAAEGGVDAVVGAVVDPVDWRAMPSPSALATPMLREATRARLRAAGCGRFLVMGRTYGPAVSGWSGQGERQVRIRVCPSSRNISVSE
jgi:hypothetical protein